MPEKPPDNPDLEAGLRAGFGSSSRRDESVLEVLQDATGGVPRVHLHDPEDDDAPLVDPRSPEVEAGTTGGRYQLVGEIARGGVGAVLRGRDKDLGRDVAIKVLREEHASDPVLVHRFVEEAQIGGQLQHPGIVPVYELGLRADRRPFFTMKMVKGRTLAALLETRVEVAQDRRRFLTRFEQVVQTLAYAHARGVIHRDLKPSNIMVGTFGEVQVMDWGLAKVLGREEPNRASCTGIETVRTETPGTESRAGSILGTPAYMPPEQARGEVERLDERADVFALGAILCEILTGAPPYKGETWLQVHQKAAAADLEEARKGLAECNADAELKDLVLSCLEPEPKKRPRNAEVLAGRFSAHLAAVDARAQAAERSAAEAEARAEEAHRSRKLAESLALEEGRRRRLTLGLAAAIVVLAAGLWGGYVWMDSASRNRADAAAAAVLRAADEADRFRDQAMTDADGGLEHWARAVSAAQRGEALSRSDDVVEALRDRVRKQLEDMKQEEVRARRTLEVAQKEARLAARIQELRLRTGEAWNQRVLEAALVNTFLEHGLDVGASTGRDVSSVQVHAMTVGLGLDCLARVRRSLGMKHTVWQRPLDLALEVDPDTFRNKIRHAVVRGDLNALVDACKGAGELEAVDLVVLAEALAGAGQVEAAMKLLEPAQRRLSGEAGIHQCLSGLFAAATPPRWKASVRCFTAVLALRPDSPAARVNLALALDRAGEKKRAQKILEGVLQDHPDLGKALAAPADKGRK